MCRYDTLDQTKLNDADKQFLGCLQTIPDPSTNLSQVGRVYQNIYIVGTFLNLVVDNSYSISLKSLTRLSENAWELILKSMLVFDDFAWCVGLVRFLIPYRDILLSKMKQGKQDEELALEVIVKEVKEQNADTRWAHVVLVLDDRLYIINTSLYK